MLNAFSVDVEDYFQVGAFEHVIERGAWDSFQPRVVPNTRRLLELCARHGVRGTFFVLGWIAERWPGLVREIDQAGHELAVHGYDHQRVTGFTPDEFRRDLRRSRQAVEDAAGVGVVGYRAPNYSIVEETLWAADVLLAEGFLYDSSIFPTPHRRHGIAKYPRFPWAIRNSGRRLLIEFPISTVRIAGLVLPFVGGAYSRQLPWAYVRWGMRRLNRDEGRPAMVYTHPWEIDMEQPRQDVGAVTRLRHYRNLGVNEGRLVRLFEEFEFGTVREVLAV